LIMEIMALLETIRNKLATVPGVKTCKIGLEANILPEDYPMVRLVPSGAQYRHQYAIPATQ